MTFVQKENTFVAGCSPPVNCGSLRKRLWLTHKDLKEMISAVGFFQAAVIPPNTKNALMVAPITQPSYLIEIHVGNQRLQLFQKSRMIRDWSCSTSKFGVGFQEGSQKTPLGRFVVRERHGEGAEIGTIFRSRKPVGIWRPGMETQSDLVLTRILWLHGLDPINANTWQRYIYIHGTNDEDAIGRPASHGCIRLRNQDMIELFDLTPEGTAVWIQE